jgi:hypothetical protein
MPNNIAKNLANELTNTVNGETWFSLNFRDAVGTTDADTAVKKLKGFPNSIVEIVVHMTQWKRFCIKKIESDAAFDIALNSPEDWKRFNAIGEEEWQNIKKEYVEATEQLAAMIAVFPGDRLDDMVPGRTYPFFHLFVGVIQHETAHMTQISYLRRLLVS